MDPLERREQRVRRLIDAARKIADPADSLGQRARHSLPPATGLSPEGVDFALSRSLEIDATADEIRELCTAAPALSRAHVLLSANVFVAALRAIAIALAASPRVSVRCSRRESVMAELLRQASGAFDIVGQLEPEPGDHVWAYGSDETMAALRASLPRDVVLHAHGAGIGVAVIAVETGEELARAAAALAEDVVLFDQRGCLSPRLALVLGDPGSARRFAAETSQALAELQRRIPRGALSADEAADERRFRDSAAFAFEFFAAGSGSVSLDVRAADWVVPPPGRNLHVALVSDVHGLAALEASVVALGAAAPAPLIEKLRALLPRARVSALGSMQRPRLDGPVDRRANSG